jgi:chromosome segregation protein
LESLQQEQQLAGELQLAEVERARIRAKSGEIEQLLGETEQKLAQAAALSKELEQQAATRKKSLALLEAKMAEGRQVIRKQEAEKQRYLLQSAQLETHSHALESELASRYNMQMEAVRTELGKTAQQEAGQVEKQVKALRQQIENAGSINMRAIEESEAHRARLRTFDEQLKDLNSSKNELGALITELDKESKKLFKDTFALIRANFSKNFKVLFTGGEADLQITDPSNPLEAGIEIVAQPPGKQMRSIQLLSGGEKCLTAIALLFAIFEVKPSPFCILDEIDAPLDDANVDRFGNIVKLFADRCQFIIITHNKRTMAIADRIFGVSMEVKGVSKILSIDFAKSREPELLGV